MPQQQSTTNSPSTNITTTTTSDPKDERGAAKERHTVRHTIGGREYALTLWPRRRTLSGMVRTSIMIVTVPLWLPLGLLHILLLSAAPQWYRDQLFFARFFPNFMNNVDKSLKSKRKVLLQHVTGRVLDIGAGSGAYFHYYSQADHIVAVEPVTILHTNLKQAADKFFAKGRKQLTIVSDLEDLADTSESSFDWIILGNVLCEVPSVEETMQQVVRLLAPGGHVYFMEHLGCPRGTWQRRVQNVMNPVWQRVSMGCNCNRDNLYQLQQAFCNPSSPEKMPTYWQFVHWQLKNIKVGMGPMIMGLAYKQPLEKED